MEQDYSLVLTVLGKEHQDEVSTKENPEGKGKS